jgi:hypothetical protein
MHYNTNTLELNLYRPNLVIFQFSNHLTSWIVVRSEDKRLVSRPHRKVALLGWDQMAGGEVQMEIKVVIMTDPTIITTETTIVRHQLADIEMVFIRPQKVNVDPHGLHPWTISMVAVPTVQMVTDPDLEK